MDVNVFPWVQQTWPPTTLSIGPLAWDAALFQPPHSTATPPAMALELAIRPSLVCVRYSPDISYYAALADTIPSRWPIALAIAEPQFSRFFTPMVLDRLAALKRSSAQVLILNVNDPADLKAGGLPRQMQLLREMGKIAYIGLHHHDANQIEWLASHTTARVLAFPYSLGHQTARYRAIEKAHEYDMACLGVDSLMADQPITPITPDDMAFRLGEAARVLPLIAQPILGVTPMDQAQITAAWDTFRQTTPEPPKLPRSLPPD